jgi:dTDP-4-dehydrorhamnose 3,5-epimerase
MRVTAASIRDVLIIEPDVFEDQRGAFAETFRADRYALLGLPERFVQDNVSHSVGGVLRGLHLQHPNGQGKLVHTLHGEIFDVAVDVRVGSPTFGRAVSTTLSAANHRQVYIPPGFAHGFVVTSDAAVVAYKCTSYYAPECEQTIQWNDPRFELSWPVVSPIVSTRDANAPRLAEIPSERLPVYGLSA